MPGPAVARGLVYLRRALYAALLEKARAECLSRLTVIASHLARFAFREGEISFGWTRAWPAGSIDVSRMRA